MIVRFDIVYILTSLVECLISSAHYCRAADNPRYSTRSARERGKRSYTEVLGIEPYFDQPFYVGYAASGFELGLVPDGEPGSGGVQVYWAADDAAAEMDRLVAAGAEVHDKVKDVGDGIKVGLVRDPFGNLFGIIENPHFKPAEVR